MVEKVCGPWPFEMDFEIANAERHRLLSKKFDGGLEDHEVGLLRALTNRCAELNPRVSSEDYETMRECLRKLRRLLRD